MALYADPETGKPVSTHSMLKTFRRCPKQMEYKFVMRLKPKRLGRPLRLGSWMHKLLEAHGNGEEWREEHERQCKEFSQLWDEEKDDIGDLPGDCERLMLSYLWHYQHDEWKVLENELTLETELPDGSIYRCKIDKLIENQYGLWLADHKWFSQVPTHEARLRDGQSALYVWCALRNRIPVQGFIWDYGRSKCPTIPTLIKSGARVSRWATMDTDYPTAAKFFKAHPDLALGPYKPKLRYLKSLQYVPGEPQSSPFFRRVVIEKSPAMLKRVATENYHTHKRMHSYDFTNRDAVERVVERSCDFSCNFTDICTMELYGGNIQPLLKRYKVGDPMEYYQDRPDGYADKGEG